jgi:hypothetical protein
LINQTNYQNYRFYLPIYEYRGNNNIYFYNQRRQWLENALVGMSVNPVQRIKACMECLQKSSSSDEERNQAMEELIEWCEQMDYAIGEAKILYKY